jgi:hypothetical protein
VYENQILVKNDSLHFFDTAQKENDRSNSSYIITSIFVAGVNVFSRPFPSSDNGDMYADTV